MVQYVLIGGACVRFICSLKFRLGSLACEVCMLCKRCGERVSSKRMALGFRLCLRCGEQEAKRVRHCVVPMNKSNYVVVSDAAILRQLNPKRCV